MMKTIACLLMLSFYVLASAEEECWDREKIMEEYKAHEEECHNLAKDKEDKMEVVGCILGRYECTTDGKLDYDKFKELALTKIDKSETKKTEVGAGIDDCKTKNPDLDGHDFWHCCGEIFKAKCFH